MCQFRKHAPCNSSEIYFVSVFSSQIEDYGKFGATLALTYIPPPAV